MESASAQSVPIAVATLPSAVPAPADGTASAQPVAGVQAQLVPTATFEVAPAPAMDAEAMLKANAKRPWTDEEDKLLLEAITKFGAQRWPLIASVVQRGRAGKQCRERWFNHLCPQVKKGEWTEEEDRLISEGVAELGTKWSEIVKRLPGRTDNAIKNRYNSQQRRLQRRARASAVAAQQSTHRRRTPMPPRKRKRKGAGEGEDDDGEGGRKPKTAAATVAPIGDSSSMSNAVAAAAAAAAAASAAALAVRAQVVQAQRVDATAAPTRLPWPLRPPRPRPRPPRPSRPSKQSNALWRLRRP